MRLQGWAWICVGSLAGCAGGGNTGEGSGPTAGCTSYLTCLEAAGSDDLDLQREVYGEGADCWGNAEAALTCTQACEAGILAERTVDPTTLECWSEGAPSTIELFSAIGSSFEIVSGEPEADCGSLLGIKGELVGSSSANFDIRVRVSGYLESLPCTLADDASFTCDGYETSLEGAFNPGLSRFNMSVDFYYSSCESIRGRLL